VSVRSPCLADWVIQSEVDAASGPVLVAGSWPRSRRSKRRIVGCARTWRSCAGQQPTSSGNSTPATADHGLHRHHESRGPRGRVDLSGPARAGRFVAARPVSDAHVSDAHVVDAVRDIAWTTKVDSDGVVVRKLSPEGLYGRRKMTTYLRRTAMREASAASVDRATRTLGLSGVRRDKGTRTTIPAKDGIRAGHPRSHECHDRDHYRERDPHRGLAQVGGTVSRRMDEDFFRTSAARELGSLLHSSSSVGDVAASSVSALMPVSQGSDEGTGRPAWPGHPWTALLAARARRHARYRRNPHRRTRQ